LPKNGYSVILTDPHVEPNDNTLFRLITLDIQLTISNVLVT